MDETPQDAETPQDQAEGQQPEEFDPDEFENDPSQNPPIEELKDIKGG